MIRFSIPAETLEQLRAFRAAKRAEKRAQPSETPPEPPVALDHLFLEVTHPDTVPQLAARYVAGMDASQQEIEETLDAFLLDPGFGPMTYLTADGRVFFDNRTFEGTDPEFAVSLEDAVAALVVGAKKTGIPALLDLIPPFPEGLDCPLCQGRRWAKPTPKFDFELVCLICRGRGKASLEQLADAKQRNLVQ